jgi:glycosyltransferase involved in cell wall biosynthesis
VIIQVKKQSESISVIIPAFNEEPYIGYCLESIRNLNTMGLKKEIIVVDNGSTDNTIEICKSYGAQVLIKEGGTIASLRNFGAKASNGDFMGFLDADCIVPSDWLEKAFKYLRESNKAILGFRMLVPQDSNWVAKSWDLLFAKRNFTQEVDWIPSGNMIMKREAFMSINGFNETLETNEDYDFCFRVKKDGYSIISCADTSVIHLRPPQSLSTIFRKELWHGKEVFKVFYEDFLRNRDFNILQKKNSKVILYAFVYLLFVIFIFFSLALALSIKLWFPLFIALALPIIISSILALTYARSIKEFYLIPGMTMLLMIYGFSRAISLLPFKTIKRWVMKTLNLEKG